MSNYKKFSQNNDSRIELKDKLGLTGAEISINKMPKGAEVPFIHSHKENEEIYLILSGSGIFTIDNEKVNLKKGDYIKIEPKAKRQMKATDNLEYVCIQVKKDSLTSWTATDAVIEK